MYTQVYILDPIQYTALTSAEIILRKFKMKIPYIFHDSFTFLAAVGKNNYKSINC